MNKENNEYKKNREVKLLELKKKKLINEDFFPKNEILDLKEKYSNLTKEILEKKIVKTKLAGRVLLFRLQGKSCFLTIQDFENRIQLYISKSNVIEKYWDVIDLLDVGDIVGVEGILMKTNVGELTIKVQKIYVVTKCLNQLPDKHKGLEDIEEIYRKRYFDLIVNEKSRHTFITRFKIINEIRNFLNSKNFYEVETPILTSLNSGAFAKPFVTKHNALGVNLNLRIATELPLKQLIVGGFKKVYEMGRIFRNEGISYKHYPEFTSIEIYEAFSNAEGMIKLTIEILRHLQKKIFDEKPFECNGKKIDFSKEFKKIEMVELIKEKTGVCFKTINSFENAIKEAEKHEIKVEKTWNSIGFIINAFFEEKCEKFLEEPTFVTGYPIEISPLAKKRETSPLFTERFELFIQAKEYANGYSELNDAREQLERFKDQEKQKKLGNEEASDVDYDFVEALEVGMPPTGGLGIGIDRLVMLFTNSKSIKDVILFPTLKPK